LAVAPLVCSVVEHVNADIFVCATGNTKTPRSKPKRVARLDKIMDDMKRCQKMDEEASHEVSAAEQAALSEK